MFTQAAQTNLAPPCPAGAYNSQGLWTVAESLQPLLPAAGWPWPLWQFFYLFLSLSGSLARLKWSLASLSFPLPILCLLLCLLLEALCSMVSFRIFNGFLKASKALWVFLNMYLHLFSEVHFHIMKITHMKLTHLMSKATTNSLESF